MADDTIHVLDAVEVARAPVFGVSMGGLIAQELTLRHPDRVASRRSFSAAPTLRPAGHVVLGQLEYEGAGHLFWTDQTDRTIEVVNEFLACDLSG